MSLLEHDVSVREDGQEKSVHRTEHLLAAAYQDDVTVHRVAWHWHDEFELFHLHSGSVQFMTGAAQYHLEAGDAIFINSRLLHGAWSEGEASSAYHSVVFHPLLIGGNDHSVFYRKYVSPVYLNQKLPYMRFREDGGWQSQAIQGIERIWELLHAREQGYEFLVREQLSACFFQIWLHCEAAELNLSKRQIREGERVKLMLRYMEEHLSEDISSQDIANASFISNTECLRCFRSILHTTPKRLLRQKRLQRAEKLLLSTTLRVEVIGSMCGFGEMSYFARCFREEYGENPAQYRAGHRSEI